MLLGIANFSKTVSQDFLNWFLPPGQLNEFDENYSDVFW